MFQELFGISGKVIGCYIPMFSIWLFIKMVSDLGSALSTCLKATEPFEELF